jgi:hypothetical protein
VGLSGIDWFLGGDCEGEVMGRGERDAWERGRSGKCFTGGFWAMTLSRSTPGFGAREIMI